MALDNSVISIIVDKLKEVLIGAFFDHPYNLTNNHYAFPYHNSNEETNGHRGTLIVSVDSSNPFITYSYNRYTKYKVDNIFINFMQKIAGTRITAIKKIEMERVVVITCENINSTSDSPIKTFDLIIELFPQRPNIILTNHEDNRIVIAYKERSDLATNKYLNRNTMYCFPLDRKLEKNFTSLDDLKPFFSKQVLSLIEKHSEGNLDSYVEKILTSRDIYLTNKGLLPLPYEENDKIIDIINIYEHYVEDQKQIALFLKERKLFNLINEQLKIAKRKKENLLKDLSSNKQKLIYKDYGQILFLYQTEYDGTQSILKKDGLSIPLDKDLNFVDNANIFFARYHKAKNAIPILESLITQCDNDILYLEKKLLDIHNGSNRDLMELKIELTETGYLKSKKQKKWKKAKNKKKNYEPHYIVLEHAKIGFGQNDLQNETLTFNIAGIHDLFFHVKDHPGAHVVLMGEQRKDYQEIACELALFLSHLMDGEVMVSEVKNIKKNKMKKGLVTFKTYNTITIKKIKESSLQLFKENI